MRTIGLVLAAAAAMILGSRVAAAAPDAKQTFEQRCLFCHSGSVIEQQRLTVSGWRQLVLKMQARAPLLIGPNDVAVIVRYLVRERKLVPPRTAARARPMAPPASPAPAPTQVPSAPEPTEPEEELAETSPESIPGPPGPPASGAPGAPPASAAPAAREIDVAAEALGPPLLEQRCSKCHSLFRVYSKIDSVALGDSIIERMSRKTGSGISPADADILKRFLRSRAAQ